MVDQRRKPHAIPASNWILLIFCALCCPSIGLPGVFPRDPGYLTVVARMKREKDR
jgi:hypothetical protein